MCFVDWLYNRKGLMIREATYIARECQSLSRNRTATTMRTTRLVPRSLRLTLARRNQDRGGWMSLYQNVEMILTTKGKISNGVFRETSANFPRLKTRRDSLRRRRRLITIITTHRLHRRKAFAETLFLGRVILVWWWHRAIWLIRSRLRPRCVRIVRRDSVLIEKGCRLMRLWRLGVALAAWGWSNRNRNRNFCNSSNNKKNVLLVHMIISFFKNRRILDFTIRKKRFSRPWWNIVIAFDFYIEDFFFFIISFSFFFFFSSLTWVLIFVNFLLWKKMLNLFLLFIFMWNAFCLMIWEVRKYFQIFMHNSKNSKRLTEFRHWFWRIWNSKMWVIEKILLTTNYDDEMRLKFAINLESM